MNEALPLVVVAPRHLGVGLVWAMRLAIVASSLWVCTSSVSIALLERLIPAQRAVFAALMSDFTINRFELVQSPSNLKQYVAVRNARYLIIDGRALAPGIAAFTAETAGRPALLGGALVVAGLALLLRPNRRALLAAVGVSIVAIPTLVVVEPAVLLAGQVWSFAVPAFSEPSLAALLVGASEFLVYGGRLALCAAVVWVGVLAGSTYSKEVVCQYELLDH